MADNTQQDHWSATSFVIDEALDPAEVQRACLAKGSDEDLKKEGKADEKAGRVRELLEEANDKAEDLIDTVKDKITKH